MTQWNESDIEVVRRIVVSEFAQNPLTKGQRYEVLAILGSLTFAAATLLGSISVGVFSYYAETVSKEAANGVLRETEAALAETVEDAKAIAAKAAIDTAANLTVSEISTRLVENTTFVEAVQAGSVQIPSEAVIAFDEPRGCPIGWSDLSAEQPSRFARRVIVALDHKDDSESQFGYGETGGEERVTLTDDEMPSHSHILNDRGGYGAGGDPKTIAAMPKSDPSGRTRADGTHSTGGGQSHNNMPPYIALYFCKKD